MQTSSYSFDRTYLSEALESIFYADTGKKILGMTCPRPKLGIFDTVKAAGVSFFSFLATSMYIKPSIEFARLYPFIPANILQWPYIISSTGLNAFVNSYFGKIALDSVIIPMFKDIFNVLRLNIVWNSCGDALKRLTKWFFSHVIEIAIAFLTAYPFYAVDVQEHARDYYGELLPFLKSLTQHTDLIVLVVSALLFLCGVRDCISSLHNLYLQRKKPDAMAVKQALIARFEAANDDFHVLVRRGDAEYQSIVKEVNKLRDIPPDNERALRQQNINILLQLCEKAPGAYQANSWRLAATKIAFILGIEMSLLGYFFGSLDTIRKTLKLSIGGAILPSIGVFAPLAWLAGEVAGAAAKNIYQWIATKKLILPLSFAHSPKIMYGLSVLAILAALFSAVTPLYLNETTPWLQPWRAFNYVSFLLVVQLPTVLMTALFNSRPFANVAARTERAVRLPVNEKTSEEKRKQIYYVNYVESLINIIKMADPSDIMKMLNIIATTSSRSVDQRERVINLLFGHLTPAQIFPSRSRLSKEATLLSAITTYFQLHLDEEQGIPLLSASRASSVQPSMSINFGREAAGRGGVASSSYGATFSSSYAGRGGNNAAADYKFQSGSVAHSHR